MNIYICDVVEWKYAAKTKPTTHEHIHTPPNAKYILHYKSMLISFCTHANVCAYLAC